MDLSRDEEGATQDRSNAPITNTNDPEQVRTLPSPPVSYLRSLYRSVKPSAAASSRGK